MENKKVLFVTFDMSGYYINVYEELKKRYTEVDFYNMATMSYRYKNAFEKVYSFFYKIFTGRKLKNRYKYQGIIDGLENKSYDITLVVRPDLFFDSQLLQLKEATDYFVAYYHDSIANIKRKKDVIPFFDKVYSYEKKDVADYGLTFLPNFIYFSTPEITELSETVEFGAFSVMSKDYRLKTIQEIARFFQTKKISYAFFVMNKKAFKDGLITFFTKRMQNETVVNYIKKSRIIVDVHKYGVQDGLTFRVFEAIGYQKKLITTNKDIAAYDFYNPNNIFIIENPNHIAIPEAFLYSDYQPVPATIYENYTLEHWLTTILKR